MRQFEMLEAMTFKHGRFKLTAEQLANRRYVVRPLGEPSDLVVEPITEISFKRGEIIETDLDVPRALESKMRPWAPELPATESQSGESKLVEPKVSASTDLAAGGSNENEPAAAKSSDTDDPLANLDIGGDSPSAEVVTADQKPSKSKRGK